MWRFYHMTLNRSGGQRVIFRADRENLEVP